MQRLTTLGLANINNSNTPEPDAITPNGFIDPRSPTFEYKRTPIAYENDKEQQGGSGDALERTPGNNGTIKNKNYES